MPQWVIDLVEFLRVNSDAIGAAAAIATTIIAVVTAILAVAALRSAARDSRERSRPLVFARFRESENSDSSYELVIGNSGQTAARDLTVTLTPAFDETALADKLVKMIAERYESPIGVLPPGGELTNVWWSGSAQGGGTELQNHIATPDDVEVSVSYKGNRTRRYRDTFTLEAKSMKLKTYSVSSTSMPGMTKSIRDSIKKLATETKQINRHLRSIDISLEPDKSDGD
ncbi:hypothetical protein PUY80_15595 [Plantibacter flavus]|uniref:hypothetical protein n=1 Tax=Plantibacter flavus TaxID=150123 RepID=UPI0023788F60|nr:hypothetical protein [Plantibacter flavus]MDD9153993.1 hypothetical protein [Plantibacter flavus]